MKILFCIYKLDFADHIALSYLSAIARQLNHSSYFCSLDSNDLVATVSKIKPDIVAYSVNITGYRKIIEAHQQAIKVHDFVSIMGGPHPTYSPETFLESGMDAYCVGEGEYAFKDFITQVEKGDSFDAVANLITREKINPVRSLIQNLDDLPPADRDLVLSNSYLKNTPKKTFYATRGCPFNCTYCCNNYYHELYKGKGPTVRRFSVERIISEIENVKKKYKMSFVKFGDDCFAIKADKWLEEFAEKYPRRIGVPFNCFLRLDTVDDSLLKLLKEAGCFSVHLSVDSASRHVMENIFKRKMRSANMVEKLRKIHEYKINTWVNYMLAAPESSLQDDLDTIKLSRKGKVTYPSYTTTVPMKGTELYNYCVEHGLINDDSHKSDMSGCAERSALLCFTEKEKDVRYNIYLLGALISKIPYPLSNVFYFLIKIIPPNIIFKKIRHYLYEYFIANKIFLLPKVKKKDVQEMEVWTKIMD
ncbi:MAG TPA: B12-binding domain-containing radical SAM protein [Candidatus Wunengus sp. YC61]|uniref:B12-binding domain-containing radical SAM protein n=1 Tax=Candidatus Wunengus sp. YC61 TaxID=3367698 RepID=UPI004027D017